MKPSQFMDKQIMDLAGSSSTTGGAGAGELLDLMNPREDQYRQGGSSNNGSGVMMKEDILPSYDFQPIRNSGYDNHGSVGKLDGAARSWGSGDSKLSSDNIRYSNTLEPHEQPKLSHGMEREAYDVATVREIDRTVKKYVDNLLRTLEGLSSRLVQLEGVARHLETSVDELKITVGNNSGSTDGKLRQFENILREVQTGVQVLRDKQDILDAQTQLSKLQQSSKQDQPTPPPENSNPVTSSQQTPPPTYFQPPPPPQQSFQPPMPPHPSYQPPPPQSGSAAPVQTQTSVSSAPPQSLLPSNRPPPPTYFPPPQAAPPTQPPQPTPTPPQPQQHYQLPQYPPPQLPPHHEDSSSAHYMPPPPQQPPPPPPPFYDSNNQLPFSGYGQQSDPAYPYNSGSPSHYNCPTMKQQMPFANSPPLPRSSSNAGTYSRLPTAKILPQAAGPIGPGSSGGGGSGNKVPVDDVVEKVATMGFSREQVRAAVRKLTENGQSVDLNVVLDKLMNEGSGDMIQPQKGWFGR